MTQEEIQKRKKYEKEKKRVQRAKKLIQTQDREAGSNIVGDCESECFPYKCKQTYAKAVQKCMRSLPSSPTKKKAVVAGVAKKLGLSIDNVRNKSINEPINDDETTKMVKDFYFRPDIVYTCPGMNDTMVCWTNGKKLTLQKHYLTLFLKEAFYIFKEEFPNIKIEFSRFCALRPKNVLLLKDTPSEQCKCMIHENFILKLKCLKISYNSSYWSNILCDTALDSSCWRNVCDTCKNGSKIVIPYDPGKNIIYKQWKKGDDQRVKLKTEEISCGELHENLISDLPYVMYHINIKRVQAQAFQSDKNNEHARILQIDFAMSYSCAYQNEVQSALWSRESVTLFTAASFFMAQCKTFVICSDTKQKDKDSIFAFVTYLYDKIFAADHGERIKEVIWSDGPSSEFKNRYMVSLLVYLSERYSKQFEWKYFATSHGKGVVDGVGGNIKRLVNQKARSQGSNTVIQNANDFAKVAATLVPSTSIFYISASEIADKIRDVRPWESSKPIPGISKFHEILANGREVTCKSHAQDNNSIKFSL